MLLISSCAWIPPGDKPAEFLKTPSMKHALPLTERDETPAPPKHWPHERWWREFGSSELNGLMDTALKENIGLKVAASRLHQAQALVRVEGARLLPFLDAQA
ncbi:MAG: histidine kinase, partial [Methylobacter sp.]|nr:histidine kinase [Methylobacter sp.]